MVVSLIVKLLMIDMTSIAVLIGFTSTERLIWFNDWVTNLNQALFIIIRSEENLYLDAISINRYVNVLKWR